MKNNKVEFLFLKASIEQFIKDIQEIDRIIAMRIISEEELLEIMSYLVAIKENIESLEIKYLEKHFCY